MKKIILILSTLIPVWLYFAFILILSLTACSCNPEPNPPDSLFNDSYMPDSVKFPQQTGDTAIFISINEEDTIYETFIIENGSYMQMEPVHYNMEVTQLLIIKILQFLKV